MTFHIAEYDEVSAKIDEMADAANFIPDASSKEGYDKSKRVALDIGKAKTILEKARKAKKKHFLDGGREVDSQAKVIMAKLDDIQLPHTEAYKEVDDAKKAVEASRVAAHEERLETIRVTAELLAESTSEEIQGAMEAMQAEECEGFQEFTEQALKARNQSRKDLGALFVKVQQKEKDDAELKRLRDEAYAREVVEHEEQIRKDAAAKADSEREAAVLRENEAKVAQGRAELEAAQAKANAKILAEKAAEDAKQAEINRQKAAVTQELAAKQAREADIENISRVRRGAKEAFMHLGASVDLARAMVLAIDNGAVPNVTINY